MERPGHCTIGSSHTSRLFASILVRFHQEFHDFAIGKGTETIGLDGSLIHARERGPLLHRAALDRGLLLRPLGNTVYFMPPYVIEEDHMDMLVGTTCDILDRLN